MTGSLQIRRGAYHCVLNFKNEMGKRKQKWINTKLEVRGNKKRALQMLNELLTQHSDKDFYKSKEILFVNYLNYWLENKKNVVKKVTWDTYERYSRIHIIPYFKTLNLRINEVKPKHILDFYNLKAFAGRLDGKEGGCSWETLHKQRTILKGVFKQAIIEEIIERNPAEKIELPLPKKRHVKQSF